MRSIILGFGLMILCLLVLFKIGEVNFIRGQVKLEVIVALAALVFFFIGVYFNRSGRQASKNFSFEVSQEAKIPSSSKETPTGIDPQQVRKAGLSQREHEVLLKMAEGLSNNEIAAALFLSESTIKTHVSNILFKLEVKRRTAAIQAAKQLRIIP
jgi:DNA-binding NarL/FixJ family response regulator